MWIFIMLGTTLAVLAGFVFLISRVKKFSFIKKIAGDRKLLQNGLSTLIMLLGFVIVGLVLGLVNLFIVALYLTAFWLLSELFFFLFYKIGKKEKKTKVYLPGMVALLVTIVYMSLAYYNDHHVVIKEYKLETKKDVEPLRIAMFSDSHMGTTFDGEGFGRYVDEINALGCDIVVIAGDFIDGSSKEVDIQRAIEHLGRLTPKYGTYFVFGNHDKNYYGEERGRQLTTAEYQKMLEDSGVVVLEDELAALPGGYTIVGRQDREQKNRADIASLMEKVEADSYVIDLNHQPNDYAAEEKAAVDLVLSGHTHGGQFWIIHNFGKWSGLNDQIYGIEKRGNTDFIVSSGISDWAIDFKTGCPSEIVLIDIKGKK